MDQNAPAASGAVVLRETLVGQLAGCSVGVSNIWTEDFSDDQGQARHGLRGTISVFRCPPPHQSFRVRVHQGQRIQVAGSWFEVSAITEDPNGRGTIALSAAP